MIDFSDLSSRVQPVMYDTDVLKHGQIGGHCKLNKELLKKNSDFMSSLQSWGPEMQNFVELPQRTIENNSTACDRIITQPTIIMKIDASKLKTQKVTRLYITTSNLVV